MDCKCYVGMVTGEIVQCKLCKAASAMYEALKLLLTAGPGNYSRYCAERALAKAEEDLSC